MSTLAPLPPGLPRYADGFCSPGGVTVAYEEESVKHHVIEGDGLCPLIYQHLHKNTKGGEHTLTSIRLPDTVVFDHNFPRAWYTYDVENRTIVKRSSKLLDAQTMYDHFAKDSVAADSARQRRTDNGNGNGNGGGAGGAAAGRGGERGCDIVAQFFYTTASVAEEWKGILSEKEAASGRYDGQQLTYVSFFTAESLHRFLFLQQRKPDGVLQKFVVPKGEGTSRRNSQLQVSWSPLLTSVYKRTNHYRLDDTATPLPDRASTYDGARWHSDESMVADETKVRVTALCEDVAAHFYATEGKQITRLVLYFKTDDLNNMWLLWCGGVRVAADSLNPSFLRVPLAMDMRMEVYGAGRDTVARVEGRRLRQRQLLALDKELYEATKDIAFALTAEASHKRQAKALDMHGKWPLPHGCSSSHPLCHSLRRVGLPNAEEEAAARRARGGAGDAVDDATLHGSHGSGIGQRGSVDGAGGGAAAQVREELVALAMDAWYAVYSTTLAENPKVMATRRVAVAAPLLGVLTAEELDVLTRDILGLVKAPPAEGPRGSSSGGGYIVAPYVVTSGRRLDRPSSQVETEVQDFFTDLFAHRGPEVTKLCLDEYALYFDDV